MAENTSMERLAALYPEMNEAQLCEILAGEEAGIDFASFADPALTAEEMKAARAALVDRKRRAVCAFECRYFYGTIKYFELFMNPRELLYSSLIEEKNGVSYRDVERWASSNGQLQGKMNKIYETLTEGLEVCDLFETDARLPERYTRLIEGIVVRESALDTEILLPIEGCFDVYRAFGKGEFDTLRGVRVTPDTAFPVRAKLSSGADTVFTLALTSESLSVALAAVPNRSATKSDADLAVAILDGTHLWYDNAAKYVSPALLVAGLRS